MKYRIVILIFTFCLLCLEFSVINKFLDYEAPITKHDITVKVTSTDKKEIIKISAVGDCTIGTDPKFGNSNSFMKYSKNGEYDYYFKNVADLFSKDDITVANLEGTFTDSNDIQDKKFNFKAGKEYVNVLKKGNVDVVTIANNHSKDFGLSGYNDTIDTLKNSNVDFYGYDNYLIKSVKNKNVCFFGIIDIYGKKYTDVLNSIKYFDDKDCDLLIASMHWGIEGDYKQSDAQVKMGHYLIDNGVDLVIGSHPHLIQGIEKYNKKYIVYSLGNFVFGGNQNPKDKDTFIFQQNFTFINDELKVDDDINIIPAKISSINNINNYQPIILDGEEKEKVYNKIMNYSSGF